MGINVEMKNVFDEMASSWENSESEFAVCEKIVKLMQLKKDSVIADIGCGKGVMLSHLLTTIPESIYAVDISSEMLQYAQKKYRNERILFINNDVLKANLPKLDTVMIYNAYPHLINKTALAEKLAKCVNVGGCVVIAHSSGRNVINGIHKTKRMERLSKPLRAAIVEAGEFFPYFDIEKTLDNDNLYYIKLIRNKTSIK